MMETLNGMDLTLETLKRKKKQSGLNACPSSAEKTSRFQTPIVVGWYFDETEIAKLRDSFQTWFQFLLVGPRIRKACV